MVLYVGQLRQHFGSVARKIYGPWALCNKLLQQVRLLVFHMGFLRIPRPSSSYLVSPSQFSSLFKKSAIEMEWSMKW